MDNEFRGWALASLTVISVAAICGLTMLGLKAFGQTESGGAKSFGLLFQRSIRFSVATLIVVIVAILALAGALSEGVVAAMGTIAGVVLGGARQSLDSDAKTLGEKGEER